MDLFNRKKVAKLEGVIRRLEFDCDSSEALLRVRKRQNDKGLRLISDLKSSLDAAREEAERWKQKAFKRDCHIEHLERQLKKKQRELANMQATTKTRAEQ